jgi:hypothetical protein
MLQDKRRGEPHVKHFAVLTWRRAESRVTSSLLPRSTTFVPSFCTNRSLPPCPAAAHSRDTDPKSSCRSAGTAVACAAAMLKAAAANAGEESKARSCESCTGPIASSCIKSDVAGSSSSTRHSDSAGTPSHLRHATIKPPSGMLCRMVTVASCF